MAKEHVQLFISLYLFFHKTGPAEMARRVQDLIKRALPGKMAREVQPFFNDDKTGTCESVKRAPAKNVPTTTRLHDYNFTFYHSSLP
jgi:hypothetical protein